jgi:hypothetical protein
MMKAAIAAAAAALACADCGVRVPSIGTASPSAA